MNNQDVHNLESKFIAQVFREFFTIEGDVQIVLRGHLYCESCLMRLVRHKSKHPELLDDYRGGFANLLTISTALGFTFTSFYESLVELNSMRNRVAHRLEYAINKPEAEKLQKKIMSGLEKAGNNSTEKPSKPDLFSTIAQWYFEGSDNAQIILRRSVFFMWAMLELDFGLRLEGFSLYASVEKLLNESATIELRAGYPEFERAMQLFEKFGSILQPGASLLLKFGSTTNWTKPSP